MTLIDVRQLAKAFSVPERDSGLLGAVRGLWHRRHRTVKAIDGLSFSVAAGELIGVIGPNGAGKSTTIKVLSGILVPDSGECLIGGRVPWRERTAHVARIGVVFGQRTQLWWDLPVIESFDLLRDIYRVEPTLYKNNLEQMTAMLELAPLLDVPVRQLSLGQRMRCDLAAALLHSPDILFLDEPTIGLDALAKLAVRAFIQRLGRERPVTTLLTTHDLDDIETLCQRVLVIGHGKAWFDGPLAELRARVTPERRLTVDFAEGATSFSPPVGVRIIRAEGQRHTLGFDPGRTPAADLIGALARQWPIRDLLVENTPIDEIVEQLYRRLPHEGPGNRP